MINGSWLQGAQSGPWDRHGGGWMGGRRPGVTGRAPLSHEPRTINNRLINELFDYIYHKYYVFKHFKFRHFNISNFHNSKTSLSKIKLSKIARFPTCQPFQIYEFIVFKKESRNLSQIVGDNFGIFIFINKGSHGSRKYGNHENVNQASVSPSIKSRSYKLKLKRDDYTKLSGFPFNNIYHRNNPKCGRVQGWGSVC